VNFEFNVNQTIFKLDLLVKSSKFSVVVIVFLEISKGWGRSCGLLHLQNQLN